MVHTSLLLPCHVRELPGDAIELMPIVLPMTLTSSQRRRLAEILLSGLEDPEPSVASRLTVVA
ncbi:hypothetical protein [Nonomuraea rhizosphaerae]|uniref:hypothetical protein n=1 Tax=Nonomuraea rhizosphaerae TaxID=2665663 RepID=UPI001C5D19CD|nr:hypothetical protein [Nonomuraea rhizosphaerae]